MCTNKFNFIYDLFDFINYQQLLQHFPHCHHYCCYWTDCSVQSRPPQAQKIVQGSPLEKHPHLPLLQGGVALHPHLISLVFALVLPSHLHPLYKVLYFCWSHPFANQIQMYLNHWALLLRPSSNLPLYDEFSTIFGWLLQWLVEVIQFGCTRTCVSTNDPRQIWLLLICTALQDCISKGQRGVMCGLSLWYLTLLVLIAQALHFGGHS